MGSTGLILLEVLKKHWNLISDFKGAWKAREKKNYYFFLIFIVNCKVLTYNTYLQTMYDTYATNRTILYLQKKKLIYNVRYLRY